MDDTTKRWLTKSERVIVQELDDPFTLHDEESDEDIDVIVAGVGRIAKQIIDRLCSRLDAQQEVIGKLPHSADGVPVTPGDDVTLWYHSSVGILETDPLTEWDDVLDCLDDAAYTPNLMYSTRAAAEAAHRGADAAPDSSEPSERAKA